MPDSTSSPILLNAAELKRLRKRVERVRRKSRGLKTQELTILAGLSAAKSAPLPGDLCLLEQLERRLAPKVELEGRERAAGTNPPEPAPRSLAALALLLLTLLFAYPGCQELAYARASAGWPSTKGQVQGYTYQGEPALHVSYKVDSDSYTYGSPRLHMGLQLSSPRATVLERLRYPVGLEVPVYYHPDNASVAVLQPGWRASAMIVPGILFGLGFPAFVLFTWPPVRQSIAWAAFLGTLLCAAGMAWVAQTRSLRAEGEASLGWPQANGQIVYLAEGLIYRFVVADQPYFHDAIAFEGNDEDGAYLYRNGQEVSVSYAASDPQRAVLRPGPPAHSTRDEALAWILLLSGLGSVLWAAGRWRK